jgi:hypothetical protein
MTVRVGVSGVTTKSVAVSGSTTQVKKVVVGTPVRRVTGSGVTLDGLADVLAPNPVDGSVLVYNSTQEKWVSTLDLNKQNMDGGSF